jgi:hypothetical protein
MRILKAKIEKVKEVENTYIPLTPSLAVYRKFWANKSLRGDIQEVRTTFNVTLYLAYLDAINTIE